MVGDRRRALLGKIAIRGAIECVTGLHIGASKEVLDIGSIDAPIVRDPIERVPYIPGSSLKGKLRALLERVRQREFNRYSGQGVHRHECSDPECTICRLVGSTTSGGGALNMPSRLIVRDCPLSASSKASLEQIDTGLPFAEWKFENALDRISACANPRQIERVPAGAAFDFEIVYSVEVTDPGEVEEDMLSLLLAMALLEDDYLGGHGSRGCGCIRWRPTAFVGRTLGYYSATRGDEREAAEIALGVESLDHCRDKASELILGLLEAAEPQPTAGESQADAASHPAEPEPQPVDGPDAEPVP